MRWFMAWKAPTFSSFIHSCRGLARASSQTAVASSHSSPAPLRANLSYRRSVSSPGLPSAVPSQPSMGWIATRLGSFTPCTSSSCPRGDRSPPRGSVTPSSWAGLAQLFHGLIVKHGFQPPGWWGKFAFPALLSLPSMIKWFRGKIQCFLWENHAKFAFFSKRPFWKRQILHTTQQKRAIQNRRGSGILFHEETAIVGKGYVYGTGEKQALSL